MRLIDADALKYTQAYEPCGNGQYKAVNIVYETDIEAAPTIEPKPSHDWNGWENGCGRTYDTMFDTESWKTMATDTPMVEYAPVKHGRWNDHTCTNWHGWHCSACDYETQRKTRYCPYCGAQMERSEDEPKR